MKIILSATVIAISLAVLPLLHAEGKVNALKVEMRLLDSAYKNLIDAILLDKPEIIEAPFRKVHRAKMNTEKALQKGEIKLPKNSNKLKAFVAMDGAFHEKLVKLLGAAGKKDMAVIKELAHDMLNSCVNCHRQYRK